MAKGRTLALRVQADISGLDRLDKLGKRISDFGEDMTKKVTLPLLAAGGAAFKFASDLDEASGRAAKVFEGEAARISRAAGSLDDAFSEAAFLDAASGLGAILQQIGFVEKESADLSIAWLKLSQDMASFHDTKPDEALGAIRSALAGEFEPLKRYGVFLNETIVRQKALELGLYDGVGAIDAQTRALVVNQELLAQQPKVLGDWERTAGNAANATRNLVANFTDAGAALGQELLPAGTALLKTINGWVKAFKEMDPEMRAWVVRIAAVAAAVGPLAFVFGKLLSSAKLFAGAGRLVFDAWRNIPTALGYLDLALARVGPAFAGALTAARGFAAFLAGPFGIAIAAFTAGFASDFLGMRTRFEKDMGDIAAFLDDFFGPKVFKPMTDAQWDAVEESGNAWAEQQNIISDAIYGSGGMVPTITQGADDMAEEMGEAPGKMADELLAAQFRLTDATSQLVAFMEQAITPAQEMMELQGFLASNELAQGLASNNPLISQKSQEMRDAALSRLAELQGQAYTYGNNVGTSFAAGMNAAYGWVRTASGNLAAAARGQIGINSEPDDPRSPLYGITKWGANIAKTLAAGMTSGISTVQGAASRLAGAAVIGPGALAAATAPIGGGSGGTTIINNNFSFVGVEAGGPNELSGLLQRLSSVSSGSVRYG